MQCHTLKKGTTTASQTYAGLQANYIPQHTYPYLYLNYQNEMLEFGGGEKRRAGNVDIKVRLTHEDGEGLYGDVPGLAQSLTLIRLVPR